MTAEEAHAAAASEGLTLVRSEENETGFKGGGGRGGGEQAKQSGESK